MQWLHLDDLVDNGRKYIDTRVALVKLEISQVISNMVSMLVMIFSIMFFSMMMLAFFSIALGAFLNEKLSSTYAGYLVIGFLFMIITGLTRVLWPKIKNRIRAWSAMLLTEFMANDKPSTPPESTEHD